MPVFRVVSHPVLQLEPGVAVSVLHWKDFDLPIVPQRGMRISDLMEDVQVVDHVQIDAESGIVFVEMNPMEKYADLYDTPEKVQDFLRYNAEDGWRRESDEMNEA
jgi:hypothetical protein